MCCVQSVPDLAHLLGIGVSQGPAHDCEILAEYEDLPSGNGAMAGYNTVSRILSQAHALAPATSHQQIEFLKGIIIKKKKYALACRELPLFVLGVDSFLTAAEKGLLFHGFKFFQIILTWLHDHTSSVVSLFTKLVEHTQCALRM